VQVGNGTEVMAGKTDQIKANQNYPNDDLNRLLKAASGDASAAVALPGSVPGQNVDNQPLPMGKGRLYRYSGAVTNVNAGQIVGPFFFVNDDSGTRIPSTSFKNVIGLRYIAGAQVASFDPRNGDNMVSGQIKTGEYGYFECTIDKRSPSIVTFRFSIIYTNTSSQAAKDEICFNLGPTQFASFAFSSFAGQDGLWQIFKE
jgi:hypothetical protein